MNYTFNIDMEKEFIIFFSLYYLAFVEKQKPSFMFLKLQIFDFVMRYH